MLIIPAIDLKDGCVVRLVQGKFNKKVYSVDPVETARRWVRQGAKFLHIVDLDGAFYGIPKNLKIVREITRVVNVPIEFGGGVRKIDTIKNILRLGVARVVLGTKAVEDKGFLKKAFAEFKAKIIVGVDVKEGKVMVKGWKSGYKNTDAIEFSLSLKKIGFKELIYTDILKDGTLLGPDINEIRRFLKITGLKIVASGGVSRLEDLIKLKSLEKQGLSAVIIGKALYEGRFTLAQALELS
ncbi:MAG: 1-(5-phosphoribosyl)-5-[(5-phosphoribosylamino)methylideneamino]imidazole-4-carboxamide isomerase [Candidatus Omnitrophica bacterium CG08_land_8_20_14_0_20_41_16]|uniref:1-(5-phosphoribosyl)-5-[(5-phosphoribosylamino)methylideneamino] imidazole-4-carboxamide isomerase n=1 Tax=Candidatus Sherwoodlollariibacterium unditelluris TaxID=1974757 RepID=A0A2G9YJY7_9BACT|nr:MAG: 1-(5-phosphoribosyl)-5-[(5-phosphoribosylamino)methylideneamino]imidazole-4-carboxamide isomerase [Candidatus Omnitrophica bacterium CG23_combo_of_CG06-09_8_20_14_all_41_10]PIS33658.1 MAG: 1-(5-phosphoribosyl)-5-[(5-phosphoribosylamino)methylideneamino]imidazole-4-carboxamide isomerase [Candidatus Omnitrophica bacterium CG08_land_8_20_14_0_20_41_16]